ncbi:MAG: hypothetical protein OXB92_02955 [Acidimicrobiaceae bacterium]|nr:hypothetical protein [Acidimicrobiia bacterium]MCY4492803.1 hypothetical protein [Acidimicrobiaceae bacterium]
MPVARGPQINARNALLIGFTAVVIAGLLFAMVWLASSQGDTEIVLGDRDFDAGRIGAISREIAERGPILYSDVGSSGQRDIIVTHLGTDPEQGWLAFAARRADHPRNCFFDWDADEQQFNLTSAEGSGTVCDVDYVDAAGNGLLHYEVEVRGGNIHVLLNKERK